MIVIAQPLPSTPVDPITPWMQLILQAGALGVLILLAWQVPKLIKLLKEWRDQTEEAHREERKLWKEDSREDRKIQIDASEKMMQSVLRHCDETAKQRDTTLFGMQKEIEYLQEVVSESTGKRRGKGRVVDPPSSAAGGSGTNLGGNK